MEIWVLWAMGALTFQSLKIYTQNWMSHRVREVQHVQLLSSICTILLCLAVLSVDVQPVEDIGVIALVGLIAGVGFALGNLLSSRAQRHMPMSMFHSSMRMSMFLPIPVFYFLLNEKLTLNQWTSIFSTLIPLLLIAFFTFEDEKGKEKKKGLPFLVGAILALSALKIIDVIAIKIFSVSPLVFTLISNISAAIFVMVTITVKKERIVISKSLVIFGILFGILNFLSFYMYLKAIEDGLASAVVPFMSLSVFMAISLAEIFPPKVGVKRNTKKSAFISALVAVWVVGVVLLMGLTA